MGLRALDASIKFTALKIRNVSDVPPLPPPDTWNGAGDLRPKSLMHVVTEMDPGSGALFAGTSTTRSLAAGAFFNASEAVRT